MKHSFVALIFIVFSLTFILPGNQVACSIAIIPHPQDMGFKDKSANFNITLDTVIVVSNNPANCDPIACKVLNDAIIAMGNNPLVVIPADHFNNKVNAIVIGEVNRGNNILDQLIKQRDMQMSQSYPGPEGYRIDIDRDFVVVTGFDADGTFYGIQTLTQLMNKNKRELQVRSVTITDFPDMTLRSGFYGYYLHNLEKRYIERAYKEIPIFAKFKMNMLDLANHHYGHVEMAVPETSGTKDEIPMWKRFKEIFEIAKTYHLRPHVGGWARWENREYPDSPWGVDPTTLEGIRTTQTITMHSYTEYDLIISSGQTAYNVLYDKKTGKPWDKEPVVVSDVEQKFLYKEDEDYTINFHKITPPFYTAVHHGEGEPQGYPLRWGESQNGPTTIKRTVKSRIADGQAVKVSFTYIGPDPFNPIKVRYCRTDHRLKIDDPENYIWRWCVQPINYFNANAFALDVDETRVFAWDTRCLTSGKSRDAIYADDIKYYYNTIRNYNPKARIFAWSDMFDPNHNAAIYKTTKAIDLLKSYGMGDIIMIPWFVDIAEASIKFFSLKGFSVMASVQDNVNSMSAAPIWAHFLRTYYGKSHVPYGLMHAEWNYNVETLDKQEVIDRLAITAAHAWSTAPYIIHLPIKTAIAGKAIPINAQFEGDKYVFDGESVVKGPLPLTSAKLYYRVSHKDTYKTIGMLSEDGINYASVIPGCEVNIEGLEYYIEFTDKLNNTESPKSAPERGNIIKISLLSNAHRDR